MKLQKIYMANQNNKMNTSNLSNICRTCLNTELLKPIFNKEDATYYADILFTVTGVKVQIDDGFPQNICEICLKKIDDAIQFRKQCKVVEEKLFIFKNDEACDNNNLEIKLEIAKMEFRGENSIKTLQLVPTYTEIKDEYNGIEEDDKPLKFLITNLKKKENLCSDESFIGVTEDDDTDCVEKCDDNMYTIPCKLCHKVILKNNLPTHMSVFHNPTGAKLINCHNDQAAVMKQNQLDSHHKLKYSVSLSEEICCDSDLNKLNSTVEDFEATKTILRKDVIDVMDNILYEYDDEDPRRKRVTCKLCQKNLSIRSIDAHMAKCHPGADKRRIKCDLCDTVIMKQKFSRHKALIHGTEKFRCRYCKWDFETKDALIEHVGNCTARKKRRVCESSRELRECDVCHKTMQKASLRTHTAVKHAGLRPVCEHCGKKFGNKFRLHEHYRAKHGYEKFKCSYCEFRSAGVMAMRNHERRHRGEKPFVCETCGAKFHAAYLLAQHRQSHATEKQFQCDLCPAAFKANNSLHMHKRACHSTAKYACAVCARAYSCRNYAVKHMRTVHRYTGPVPTLLTTE